MKKCMIITSYIEGNLEDLIDDPDMYFIICADGGYDHAAAAGIKPDMILGDFDSLQTELPHDTEILTFPCEKNDTDTGLCISKALEMGFKDLSLIGGIGGRFDHAIANLQSMSAAAESADRIAMYDLYHSIILLKDNAVRIEKKQGQYLSLLSLSDTCYGVSVSGVKYPLSGQTLTNRYPLGVSNEFSQDHADISVEDGTLLIVLSSLE